VRTDRTYQDFMRRIESIFSRKLPDETFNHWLFLLYRDYSSDPLCVSVLTSIEKYKGELLAHRGIPDAPLTTNIMECLNSHLQGRLLSLKGFESFSHAKLWLNGYILKRRFTKLTDCDGKFKKLNGKKPVELTKKLEIALPILF